MPNIAFLADGKRFQIFLNVAVNIATVEKNGSVSADKLKLFL